MSERERVNDWVMHINEKREKESEILTQELAKWYKTSIYKVPHNISHHNKNNAYTPQVVSIGPFHHGADHLEPMEAHKQRALVRFLNRSSLCLQSLYDQFLAVAQDLMDSYDSLAWEGTTEKFVEMMIVDGCFMLEIMQSTDGYYKEDPVFGDHGKSFVVPFLWRDMLMLENQLPMQVLSKLSGQEDTEELLYKSILHFCNPGTTFPATKLGICSHVLELYRKSLLLVPEPKVEVSDWAAKCVRVIKPYIRKSPHPESTVAQMVVSANGPERDGNGCKDAVVRSTTEIREASVHIRKSKTRSLNDISFKGGILRLPTFVVDDTTESTYLNLIAFERCHVGAGHEVTSFIYLMDNLIDNPQDISILSTKGIVQNILGSDKTAADLFNMMAKDLVMHPDSELNRVQCDIVEYCRKPWQKHRASFCHTYMRSPWTLISIIAATFLFVLTIMQTVYSGLQYRQGMMKKGT